MERVLTHNQQFDTPADALVHYGVKGMKWGVRKDNRNAGSEDYTPLIAATAVYAGIMVIQARHRYVDSGKKHAKKFGKEHEWKRKESLTGPKTADEIVEQVIPDINRGYPSTPGTSMNCRRCTFAYEMRRRGYDVKATRSLSATGQDAGGLLNATKPNSRHSLIIDKESRLENRWGKNAIPVSTKGRSMSSKGKSQAIFDALSKEPDGSRGELAFSWSFGGGHSVAYEVVGGKPVIFCTQTKRTWSSPEAFDLQMGRIVGKEAAFTRLDNVNLNNEFLKRWLDDA